MTLDGNVSKRECRDKYHQWPITRRMTPDVMYRPWSWVLDELVPSNIPPTGRHAPVISLQHKKSEFQRTKSDRMRWKYGDNIINGQDELKPKSYTWPFSAKPAIMTYPARARYGPDCSMVTTFIYRPASAHQICPEATENIVSTLLNFIRTKVYDCHDKYPRTEFYKILTNGLHRIGMTFRLNCRRPKKNRVIHGTKDSVSTEYLAEDCDRT